MSERIARNAGLSRRWNRHQWVALSVWLIAGCALAALIPDWALAGTSPFATGATAANTNILTILTPVAVIAVMALGVAAWANKISWGWAIAAAVGICLVFGAQQVVTWVRGLFGV